MNIRTETAATSLAGRIRTYALARGAWSRREMVAELGARTSSAVAGLVASGELVNPARGVYALPGIHDEDPRMRAALASAGSTFHPTEKRIAAMAPAERRAAREIDARRRRELPRGDLIRYMTERRVATVSQVREDLGGDAASRLAALCEQGVLARLATGIYAISGVDPAGEEARAILTGQARAEADVVARIDSAISELGPPDHVSQPEAAGLLARQAVLKYWEAGNALGDPAGEGRAAIRRVYVEIPGYPAFFAQRSSKRIDGRDGTIAWGSGSPRLDPVMARALARKVFDPLPVFFHEMEDRVPERGTSIVPLTIRNDAHADLDPADDPAPVTIDERHPLPCAYTVADTRRLDPARLSHPLPEPVTLLVDHREPASIMTALRRVPNLDVVRTELEIGDYMVEGRIVFERKSNDDFHASLDDRAGRLIQQAEQMSSTGLHRILLIEGGPYAQRQFVLNKMASTLSYIQNVHGIHVTPTMNRQHTVYAIVQAVKHHLYGMFSDPRTPDPVDKRGAAADPSRTARLLLSHVPGLSEERVNALCDHFGSLREIAEADVQMLREVRGIGPKAAAAIHGTFNSNIPQRGTASRKAEGS